MADPRWAPMMLMWMVAVLPGLAALNGVMQRPQFESYRTVDVVQLLGAGVCFGVAMAGVIMTLAWARNDRRDRRRGAP